ncbi:MAG: hypothetical protein IJX92_07280 [Clostridia bacterium]|nr:hypothetical protein [Clostridia bacterium]
MKKLLISLTALALSLLVFTSCDLFAQEKEECKHENTVTIKATQATCTEPAYREGTKCADCGYIFKAPVATGTALGHVEKQIQGLTVTCTTDGKTPSAMCERCGEMVVKAEIITKLGHKYIAAPTVLPTCTEAGYEGGEICEYCHNYNPDESKKPKITPPLGHDIETTQKAEAATCKTTGKTTGYKCNREGCGYVSESVETAIDPTNHVNTQVTTKAKEPTCTEAGCTAGIWCKDCETQVATSEEIPALDHQMGEWVAVEGTTSCEEKAECTRDGCDYEVSRNNHNYEPNEEAGANICSECGANQPTDSSTGNGEDVDNGTVESGATT